jgi:hypothetical protein
LIPEEKQVFNQAEKVLELVSKPVWSGYTRLVKVRTKEDLSLTNPITKRKASIEEGTSFLIEYGDNPYRSDKNLPTRLTLEWVKNQKGHSECVGLQVGTSSSSYKKLTIETDSSLTLEQNLLILALHGLSTLLVHATNLDNSVGRTYENLEQAKWHYNLMQVNIEENVEIKKPNKKKRWYQKIPGLTKLHLGT